MIRARPLTYRVDGPPNELSKGVYACRVEIIGGPDLYEDKLLTWDGVFWWYLSSDEKCRRYVAGWIGPLERLQPKSRRR